MTATRWDGRRGDDGFTLVEMSVAMVVLGIVFAALGTFLVSAVKQQYTNELRSQAVQLGQQGIEQTRALPWDLAGFYADDAQASSCSTASSPVVTIDVPVSPATKNAQVPTAGTKTVTVNGTSYQRTTCIRWVDQADDGLGSADTNGPKDVKEIDVVVTWQDKSVTRTHHVTGLRAPTADEVTPRSATGMVPFGITSVTPDPAAPNSAGIDSAGNLTAPLAFTATTSSGVSTVQLRWTDADGTVQVRTMTAGSTSTSWSVTLPQGTGPFAPVQVTFSLTAYSSTGETSTQDTTVTMSHTPGTLTIVTLAATPNSVDVNGTGMSTKSFTVTATTSADATSASLHYVNRGGSSVTVSMTPVSPTKFTYTFPVGSGPFKEGASSFSVSATGLGGTATSSTTVTFVPPSVVPVTLVAYTVSPALCVANSDGRPVRSSLIEVQVQGITSVDDVSLLLGDTKNTPVKAAYFSGDASNAYYRYVIPTATQTSTLSYKGKSQLSVSVTATRKSDNTQATQLYTTAIWHRNGSTECPA